MMIQQAAYRFMERMTLGTGIPVMISNGQHQGCERQAVALPTIKSLSTESLLPSLELESVADQSSSG
jgi:hypothetical protein